MVVSHPRHGASNSEAPDMVRVQLKPNDVRSYRRRDAEQILANTPGAFILGEQPEEAAPKARRAAPNKARTTAPAATEPSPATESPAETKSEAPEGAPSDEGKGE